MGKIITDNEKIKKILERGVEDIFIKTDLEKKLKSGKELRVKLGFDPTGAKIHIGRAVILRKLKEFQDLGHKIIFIVGDFTARIGDPSDKLNKRPMLSEEQVKINLKNYKKQIGKIIDLSKAEFYFNSQWLKKLNFKEIAELAESFSVQQMLARRNFKERFEKGEEISVREFLYPLLQGYDSVIIKADVEIGGFDQLFNLKAGRIIQKHFKQEEQNILTGQMLEGTDGRKMSTSWENVINITDEANEMFGKIMSLKDELIPKYFLLCTDIEEQEIEKIDKDIKSGKLNPRDAKLELALEIVRIYHGKNKAEEAKEEWVRVFSKKERPEETIKIKDSGKDKKIFDWLFANKLTESKSEGRRLIEQGGLKINGKTVNNFEEKIRFKKGDLIKIGKKKFAEII
ncbi:MAG: tyrosine--tRNA ligase [Candidatus Pacebacteria bacterium]|nr:tyrosine--tRNA ligase [Candidatus Paceibacterota bacterium]